MFMTTSKNNREYQLVHWQFGICRVDLGPAPKMTTLDKALSIMRKYEQKGQIDSRAYDYAQGVALGLLFG